MIKINLKKLSVSLLLAAVMFSIFNANSAWAQCNGATPGTLAISLDNNCKMIVSYCADFTLDQSNQPVSYTWITQIDFEGDCNFHKDNFDSDPFYYFQLALVEALRQNPWGISGIPICEDSEIITVLGYSACWGEWYPLWIPNSNEPGGGHMVLRRLPCNGLDVGDPRYGDRTCTKKIKICFEEGRGIVPKEVETIPPTNDKCQAPCTNICQ